jgi:hypothetical protein
MPKLLLPHSLKTMEAVGFLSFCLGMDPNLAKERRIFMVGRWRIARRQTHRLNNHWAITVTHWLLSLLLNTPILSLMVDCNSSQTRVKV